MPLADIPTLYQLPEDSTELEAYFGLSEAWANKELPTNNNIRMAIFFVIEFIIVKRERNYGFFIIFRYAFLRKRKKM